MPVHFYQGNRLFLKNKVAESFRMLSIIQSRLDSQRISQILSEFQFYYTDSKVRASLVQCIGYSMHVYVNQETRASKAYATSTWCECPKIHSRLSHLRFQLHTVVRGCS